MIVYKNKDIKNFVRASIFLFIILVTAFLSFIYFYSKNYIIGEIDKRLLTAAESIKHILPADYHDRAVKPGSVSEKEYEYVERKLTEYAEKTGLQYIWTDIEYNGEYYLTSCNKTEESDDGGLKIYYFMKYEDGISSDEIKAFSSDKPVYTFLDDKWGYFRAVFIPSVSPYGNKYLSCAEYSVDYVDELLKNSTLFTFIVSVMLFVIFLPVFIVYINYTGSKEKELKNKNRELEESSEYLKITLNSISDGVIVTDNKGIIKTINKAAEEITGYSKEELYGLNISDTLKIHDYLTLKEIDCPVKEVINTGRKVELIENAVIFNKNRKKVRISKYAVPIKTGDNNLIGVVIVIRDMTFKYRLEEELRQARNIESVGKLAGGGIAHDFNNMLGAVLSSAELLQMETDDPKSLE